MAGRYGGFYNNNDTGTEYVYGPTDTGSGGGSINTGSKGKPSSEPREKPRPKESTKQKENDADANRRLDDAFMNEPSTVRGTESGAYDGIDAPDAPAREKEEV